MATGPALALIFAIPSGLRRSRRLTRLALRGSVGFPARFALLAGSVVPLFSLRGPILVMLLARLGGRVFEGRRRFCLSSHL